MKSGDIIKEIGGFGLSEKLMLVEDLWDSIAQDNAELPLPEWQKKELDHRYSSYKEGKIGLHEWEGVHEELRNKYK